jgi:osmotically-inducible protein OsmY
MKILFALIVGVAVGVAAVYFYSNNRGNSRVKAAGDQIEDAAKSTRDAVQDKLKVLDLRPEDIKADLAKTGQVVRRKAREAGQAISDATVDARTTAAIKAKLLANKDLSALSIAVNTTDGVVTLSGSVTSAEDISKAMMLAMEPEGVREVVSTLQVKPKPKP